MPVRAPDEWHPPDRFLLARGIMSVENPLLPDYVRVRHVTRDTPRDAGDRVLATRDHALIKEWARLLAAEPATGEASASGAATSFTVNDGGSGLRFNFPGAGRFRAISWEEWLDHFNRHDLTFVFENAGWGAPPSGRYRIVRTEDLRQRGLVTT